MRSGIRLGRIFGIDIYVDWSWIFIFVLVTWNLAATVFPSLHPGWGLSTNLILGFVASILFFASVLAHELAHSLVAKARGLPVRRIILFIFGGVSNIEREPSSPGEEFMVAVVGPLTSLVLGVLFLFLGGVTANLGNLRTFGVVNTQQILAGLSPLSTMLLWLGPVNLLLGIFNLVPGFPLDGGRVLRAIIWGATGSLRTATRWAIFIGHIVAWIFIITGIAMAFGVRVPVFGTGFLGGLWLAFIGWFLNNAASQSQQQAMIEDLLEGVPVARLMRADVPAVSPQASVTQLVDDYLMGTEERAFPVVEGDRLAGLVCLEDVRKIPRAQWDETRVSQIMTPADQVAVVAPREDVTEALHTLTGKDISQVPVVQDGHLVGMLRRRDIVRWLQLHSNGQTAV